MHSAYGEHDDEENRHQHGHEITGLTIFRNVLIVDPEALELLARYSQLESLLLEVSVAIAGQFLLDAIPGAIARIAGFVECDPRGEVVLNRKIGLGRHKLHECIDGPA